MGVIFRMTAKNKMIFSVLMLFGLTFGLAGPILAADPVPNSALVPVTPQLTDEQKAQVDEMQKRQKELEDKLAQNSSKPTEEMIYPNLRKDLLPSNTFYFTKLTSEFFISLFKRGDNKDKYFVEVTERRLAEAGVMVEKGKTSQARKAIDRYIDALKKCESDEGKLKTMNVYLVLNQDIFYRIEFQEKYPDNVGDARALTASLVKKGIEATAPPLVEKTVAIKSVKDGYLEIYFDGKDGVVGITNFYESAQIGGYEIKSAPDKIIGNKYNVAIRSEYSCSSQMFKDSIERSSLKMEDIKKDLNNCLYITKVKVAQ